MRAALYARTLVVTLGLLALAASPATSADGWYLLAPPWRAAIKAGEDELDTTAPLPTWQQIRAFDAARVCENARLGIIKMLEKGNTERLDRAAESYLQHPGSDPIQTKEGEDYARWTFAADRARASRCVSIADPRLR
jgi:hypothetical protein